MSTIFFLFVIFLLPIFPATLVINKYLYRLDAKFFTISLFLLFSFGILMLHFFQYHLSPIKYLALFTTIFYSIRLLGVTNLKLFILYLYSIISSFTILLYISGEAEFSLYFIELPFLLMLLLLYYFLSARINIIHPKSISGIGEVAPKFSIFFIITLLGINSTLFIIMYKMFKNGLTGPNLLLYGIVFIVSFLLINWGTIKLFEWLIYGKKTKILNDLAPLDTSTFSLLLIAAIISEVYTASRSLF